MHNLAGFQFSCERNFQRPGPKPLYVNGANQNVVGYDDQLHIRRIIVQTKCFFHTLYTPLTGFLALCSFAYHTLLLQRSRML